MFRNLQTQYDECLGVKKTYPLFIKGSREIFQFVNSDINNYKILSLSQVNYAVFIYNYI